jgi:signal transduction histidine kinase
MNIFSIPRDVDAATLRLFMQRTHQTHLMVRIGSVLIAATCLAFAASAEIRPLIAVWAILIACLEIAVTTNIRRFEVELETPTQETTQRITRNLFLMTAGLCAAHATIAIGLNFAPMPGPFLGGLWAAAILTNIACQHTLHPRLVAWTIGLPAIAICLAGFHFGVPIGVLTCIIVLQTISLNQEIVGSYAKLNRALAESKIQSEARAQADAANSAKSNFLANMSHELRTPLNAIIGYSELMREDAHDGNRPQDVDDHDKVLGSATRLLHLVNDVLDVSKIETGNMSCEIAAFDVDKEVRAACETVRAAIEGNGNKLVIEIDPYIEVVHSDAFKFGQCLLNLLSNSAKFTKDGSVIVKAWRGFAAQRDFVFVSVTDTGMGMTSAQVGGLFQPFSQADNSITRRFGGTGLGLSLTRSLARLMGGDVEVVSRPEEGSCFTMSIKTQAVNTLSSQPLADAFAMAS